MTQELGEYRYYQQMLCRLKEIMTILKEDNRLLKEHNSTAMGINGEGRIVGVNLQNVLPTDKV